MKTITYSPFLTQVVAYLNRHTAGIAEPCFVIFPTALSIDYFQSLLADLKTPSLPTCLTLHQLIQAHSGLSEAPTENLLCELHELANQIGDQRFSFEQFYLFGKTLLQDFNDLDHYCIPVVDFFLNLKQQKQLTIPLHFFDQHPFRSKHKNEVLLQQQESLLLGEKLPLLYQAFTEKLLQQRKGYNGLCYRIASNKPFMEPFAHQLIFAGFNLLTPAEEAFIIQLQAKMSVRFYWDIDPHYMDNALNIAGNYLRQHRQKTYLQKDFPKVTSYFQDRDKEIVVTEMDATLTQIQAIVERLQATTTEEKPTLPLYQTAIVLSDHQLVVPLLDKLAALSIPLHCRLNYPLNATLLYTLVVRLTECWEKRRDTAAAFDHKLEKSLLLLRPFVEDAMQAKIAVLLTCGLHEAHKGVLNFLETILTFIASHFITKRDLFIDLNRTALQYILTFITTFPALRDTADLTAIFLNLLQEKSLSFQQYNPLTGLYIVTVAESHNLDFEQLFFMDMGEGSFSAASHRDSFFPHNLRHCFGLPLLDKEIENTTAYGFYRLLQRSQRNYCSYAKQSHRGTPSEKSRLLWQLSFDSPLKITQQSRPSCYFLSSAPTISIEKDASIMQALSKFLVKEDRSSTGLTASALITYLSCPLQFYFTYLLQLKPMLLAKEPAVQLGKLLHNAIEHLYRPFVHKQFTRHTIHYITLKIKKAIAIVLAQVTEPTSAELTLYAALLEKMLERLLALDKATVPFTLVGVEISKKKTITLDEERKVTLMGTIDRIDSTSNGIRIIDYKTGMTNDRVANIATLFNRETISNNHAIFQIFLYTWLSAEDIAAKQKTLIPCLINSRALFSDSYVPGVSMQLDNTKSYTRIVDMAPYTKTFETSLQTLLLEIFNPAIPFTQTENRTICSYCPYVAICRRN